MLSCVAYMYSLMWKYEKSLAFAAAGKIPVDLIFTALTLYTPSVILKALETQDQFSPIALVIIGLVVAGMLSSLVSQLISAKGDFSEFYLSSRLFCLLECRKLDRDFELEYDAEVKKTPWENGPLWYGCL